MNPSSDGWIKKLLKEESKHGSSLKHDNFILYKSLRDCGFIYGNNVCAISNHLRKFDYTTEELSKINLVLALYVVHKNSNNNSDFVDSCISFYSKINVYKSSFIKDLLFDKKSVAFLEKIIHNRIQFDDNILTKNFSYYMLMYWLLKNI